MQPRGLLGCSAQHPRLGVTSELVQVLLLRPAQALWPLVREPPQVQQPAFCQPLLRWIAPTWLAWQQRLLHNRGLAWVLSRATKKASRLHREAYLIL